MLSKILHANDGSEHAFRAFAMALAMAKQNNSDLHMVSVEEIDYMPEFIEEVREETGTAARRFHKVVQRARSMADESHRRACQRAQGRSARHRRNRPFGGLRTLDRQPRRSNCTTRALPGPGREMTHVAYWHV